MSATVETGRWRFAHAVFDESSLQLSVRGEAVHVPKKPLQVLQMLLQHAGEVVSKDELIDQCWPGRIVTDSVLTTTLGRLRNALGDDGPKIIQTVSKSGYRLVAPVSFQGPEPAEALKVQIRAGDHPPERTKWQLDQLLGRGGYGELWQAHSLTEDAPRQVFKFASDMRGVAALKREVAISRLLAAVVGENRYFVKATDWQFDALPAFVAFDYLPAGNLEHWADSQGGLATIPLDQRLELLAQCADALAVAHTAGVWHKDVKPGNILIDTSGDVPSARLSDFGSGTVQDREQLRRFALTQMSITLRGDLEATSGGTLAYVAPEVWAGSVYSERADIYALGVLLFQMVVGDFRRPLTPGWEDMVDDELLREDIAFAAAGDPARRMASAADFAKRLRTLTQRHAQRKTQERERQERIAQEVRNRRNRRLVLVSSISTTVAVVTLGLSIFAFQQRTMALEQRAEAESLVEYMMSDLTDSLTSLGRLDLLKGVFRRVIGYYQGLKPAERSWESRLNELKTIAAASAMADTEVETADSLAALDDAIAGAKQLLLERPDSDPAKFTLAWIYSRKANELRELTQPQQELGVAKAGIGVLDTLGNPAQYAWLRSRLLRSQGDALDGIDMLKQPKAEQREAFRQAEAVLSEAIAIDTAIVENNPLDRDAWERLGGAYDRRVDIRYNMEHGETPQVRKQHQRADQKLSLDAFRRVLELDPANAIAMNAVGLSLLRRAALKQRSWDAEAVMDSSREAAEIIDKRLTFEPNDQNAKALYGYALQGTSIAYYMQGDFPNALRDAERSKAIMLELREDTPSAARYWTEWVATVASCIDMALAAHDLDKASTLRDEVMVALSDAEAVAAADGGYALSIKRWAWTVVAEVDRLRGMTLAESQAARWMQDSLELKDDLSNLEEVREAQSADLSRWLIVTGHKAEADRILENFRLPQDRRYNEQRLIWSACQRGWLSIKSQCDAAAKLMPKPVVTD